MYSCLFIAKNGGKGKSGGFGGVRDWKKGREMEGMVGEVEGWKGRSGGCWRWGDDTGLCDVMRMLYGYYVYGHFAKIIIVCFFQPKDVSQPDIPPSHLHSIAGRVGSHQAPLAQKQKNTHAEHPQLQGTVAHFHHQLGWTKR